MNEAEKKRLQELLEKKKSKKLDAKEFKEFKVLLAKAKADQKPKSSIGTPGNDFSWWNKEEVLIRDSANLKSNYIAGTKVAENYIEHVIPGVIRIDLFPTYGNSKTPVDPINVWARDLFLRMFQKYRGITSYSAADLGITLIAANEVVKTIARYERVYGVINRYSKLNVNMPRTEEVALGLTPVQADYLRGHLSDFRYDLNYLIKKAQRLCIPKDMSSIADSLSLFGFEYLDHNNFRGQIVIFDQPYTAVYSDTALSAGGCVTVMPDSSVAMFDFTKDNMCNALEVAINALLGSDGVQKIFADLVVWFGDEAMLSILPMPEDYIVVPVYSESILHKMHNLETVENRAAKFSTPAHDSLSAADQARVLNGLCTYYQYDDTIVTELDIVTNTGTFTPQQIGNWIHYASNGGANTILPAHVIDGYEVDVTPEFIVEGVLYKHHEVNHEKSGFHWSTVTTCALYIPVEMNLFTLLNGVVTKSYINQIYVDSGYDTNANAGELSVVDWAPLCYNIEVGGTFIQSISGDMDVIIPLYPNDMARIQRACVLSGIRSDVRVITK